MDLSLSKRREVSVARPERTVRMGGTEPTARMSFGFMWVRTLALVGFDSVPGMTSTSVITCPSRSRSSFRASSVRRNPMYSSGWLSSLASRTNSMVSRAIPEVRPSGTVAYASGGAVAPYGFRTAEKAPSLRWKRRRSHAPSAPETRENKQKHTGRSR